MSDVGMEKQNVRTGYPNAVHNADQKTMQEVLAAALPGDRVRTNNKNYQPTKGLDIGGNKVDGCNPHRQSEERQGKDELPVHGFLFIKAIKIAANKLRFRHNLHYALSHYSKWTEKGILPNFVNYPIVIGMVHCQLAISWYLPRNML